MRGDSGFVGFVNSHSSRRAALHEESARRGRARIIEKNKTSDFVVVSHGPDHVSFIPRTARADQFIDAHVARDWDGENYCGGGIKVGRGNLKSTLDLVRSFGLTVEE